MHGPTGLCFPRVPRLDHLLEITGGTGRYAGATGYLRGSGTAAPSTGISAGTYVGEIKLG